jgi:hypothetical protein
MKDDYRVIGFSIDKDKQALETYLQTLETPPAFETLTANQEKEFLQFGHMLKKKGLQFTGSIPYIAVFDNAELVHETLGFVPHETLLESLPKPQISD